MEVVIDEHSGFCFGVVNAIESAERELGKSSQLYCLGDIVHNNMEVKRLNDKGLEIIDHEKLKDLRDCTVLIRAHGEPPETYCIALKNNIRLIDASCPVVLRLQNRIRLGSDEMKKKNGDILIYGKQGHAEVNGLVGQTSGNAIVIGSENDLDKVDFRRPLRLYSQTTQSTEGFQAICEAIESKIAYFGNTDFIAYDTICRQVSNRAPHLRAFAKRFDVIIFVSGKKSSNGMMLYEVCKSVNPNTYLVSSPAEFRASYLKNASSLGICGATSTPMWLMEEIAGLVYKLNR